MKGWMFFLTLIVVSGLVAFFIWRGSRRQATPTTPTTTTAKKWWQDWKGLVLWIPIIVGILMLLFILFSPANHPKAFWVGVIALLVMAAFYDKWDKVFTGNKGKKTVHALLVVGVISAVVIICVPQALWHRYIGFYPMDFVTVKESERVAEEARNLLASQEDEEVRKAIDNVKRKLEKKIPLTSGEKALVTTYGKGDGDEKIIVLQPGEWVVVSKEGFKHEVFPLDASDCIQGKYGKDDFLPSIGKCEKSEVRSVPHRTDTRDFSIGTEKKPAYVKVRWSKV